MNYLFKPPLWVAILMMGLYLAGCQKTEPIGRSTATINGRVVEYGTKKPIADATIYVLDYQGVILGPEIYVITDSVKTDANGKYSFKTNVGDYMKIAKNGYFKMYTNDYVGIRVDALSSKPTTEVQPDIVLDPIGWLKIHVKNVKPEADNDRIDLPVESCLPYEIIGKTVDKTTLCKERGNRKIYFFYFITKNSISKRYEDSIYIKGIDTTYYSINY